MLDNSLKNVLDDKKISKVLQDNSVKKLGNENIQTEAKRNFKDWTQEGLSFLLQQKRFREMAITALSKFLLLNKSVEFRYNNLYYELMLR